MRLSSQLNWTNFMTLRYVNYMDKLKDERRLSAQKVS